MPPPPPKRPLARPAAAPASLARPFASTRPLPFLPRPAAGGCTVPPGACSRRDPGPYFILKLWQSVHSTMVGLDSWVPTRMELRPQ